MAFFKDRLAVVIGKHGEMKRHIETVTGTKIKINSENGEYLVEADLDYDPSKATFETPFESPELRVYATNQVLNAINYGFNPTKALNLLNDDIVFDFIDLEGFLGHSDKKLKRIKGRLIGDQGKIRNSIEQFSGVSLSIYSKYLALIGDFEAVKVAKKAINMIIQGSPHKTVLNYLQNEHQKKKQEEFTQLWKPTL